LLGGFPLVWKSQLQTEISLSTLESEYSALSQSSLAMSLTAFGAIVVLAAGPSPRLESSCGRFITVGACCGFLRHQLASDMQ